MASVFETVLNMSMTASVVILAVLLVRVFMKKAPQVLLPALAGGGLPFGCALLL